VEKGVGDPDKCATRKTKENMEKAGGRGNYESWSE